MILAVKDVMHIPELRNQTESELTGKLEAIERMIRAYTNNNFQNRNVRFVAESRGDRLLGTSAFLRAGDTIQITQSKVNDGLYVIVEMIGDVIRVNKDLFHVSENLVTKIEYPPDVKEGVLSLLKWEVENRKKAGIQSETLSRHSVTYITQDASNQVMGYPAMLMGFLKPYMKARF